MKGLWVLVFLFCVEDIQAYAKEREDHLFAFTKLLECIQKKSTQEIYRCAPTAFEERFHLNRMASEIRARHFEDYWNSLVDTLHLQKTFSECHPHKNETIVGCVKRDAHYFSHQARCILSKTAKVTCASADKNALECQDPYQRWYRLMQCVAYSNDIFTCRTTPFIEDEIHRTLFRHTHQSLLDTWQKYETYFDLKASYASCYEKANPDRVGLVCQEFCYSYQRLIKCIAKIVLKPTHSGMHLFNWFGS